MVSDKLKQLVQKKAVREGATLLALYWLYSSMRWLVARDNPYVPFQNSLKIIELESQLGIFYELAIQRWLLDNARFVVHFANHFYTVGYFPVLIALGVYLYLRDEERFNLFKGTFILGLSLALVGFSLFPLAPPRMLPELGFVDTQQLIGNMGIFNQKTVISFYNPYAAMPSMHFGWALLIGLIICEFKRPILTVIGVVYPALMVLTIIVTGHHYLMDVVGGGVVVGIAYSIVKFITYSAKGNTAFNSRQIRQI